MPHAQRYPDPRLRARCSRPRSCSRNCPRSRQADMVGRSRARIAPSSWTATTTACSWCGRARSTIRPPRSTTRTAGRRRAPLADDLWSSCGSTSRSRARPSAGRASSTTRGWTAAFDVHRGLRLARRLLLDVPRARPTGRGANSSSRSTPQYIADAVAWGAIGARTPESQVHRQLAFGPVDAGRLQERHRRRRPGGRGRLPGRRQPHTSSSASTRRPGGRRLHRRQPGLPRDPARRPHRPNYDARGRQRAPGPADEGPAAGRVMIDASHGNSGKDHSARPTVARELAEQVAAGRARHHRRHAGELPGGRPPGPRRRRR